MAIIPINLDRRYQYANERNFWGQDLVRFVSRTTWNDTL